MAIKVVLYNHKGGTGKSTSTVNISTYAAIKKHRVLVVDTDPQGNCSANFNYNIYDTDKNKTLVDVLSKKAKIKEALVGFEAKEIQTLKLLPSDNSMNSIMHALNDDLDKNNILSNALKEVEDDFDYIFIDSPPQKSIFSMNALFAANYIIIPFKPGQYEIMGLKQLFDLFEEVQNISKNNPKILGIIVTMYQMTNAVKEKIKEVKALHDDLVFDMPIPLSAAIGQSTIDALPIYFSAENSAPANAYEELTKQILEKIKKLEEDK
jgi:chromosome partitioning protein